MDLLTKADLEALVETKESPCISIFMHTEHVPTKTEQNPIRLKNLLREAEDRLVASGVRAAEARALLEPAQRLVGDGFFWQRQSLGLAIFLSPDTFHPYRVPASFDDSVMVGDRFHIKPLLPVLATDGQFYILALSQNSVRLFKGTHYTVAPIDLKDAPQSLRWALMYDNPERQLMFHTGAPGGPATRGNRAAIFHGHGVGTDYKKDNVVRYLREVDRGLIEFLRNRQSPLVLAGVDYVRAIYREVSTYSRLVDEGVDGNPEELSARELHDMAWRIVGPIFRESQENAAALYEELAGTDRTSGEIERIVPAARQGRVEHLFAARGTHQWGRLDPETGDVEVHAEAKPGDRDLIDLVVVLTLQQKGQVYVVEPERVPERGPVAAVFRY